MPPKRTARGPASVRSSSATQQQPLSFRSSKITKPATKDTKHASNTAKSAAQAVAKELSKDTSPSPAPTTEISPPSETDLIQTAQPQESDVVDEDVVVEQRDPIYATALSLPDARIASYWTGKERARLARRVHQEDLGTWEKVLREFDVSSRFGPSIGIDRLARWERARGLGLEPPVEVLAVLLKDDQKKGRGKIGRKSIVDEIMGGKTGELVN